MLGKTLMLMLWGDWRGSEDDIRGRDASVAVRVAAELSVAATRAPGQRLSILIFPARQSPWLVLSDVWSTMHYVLYMSASAVYILLYREKLNVHLISSYFYIYLLQSLHWSPSAHWPYWESRRPPDPPQISPSTYNSDYHRQVSINSTDLVPFCTAPRMGWWCGRGHRCPPGLGESAGLGGRSTRGPGAREIGRAARSMRSEQTQKPGERQRQSASSRWYACLFNVYAFGWKACLFLMNGAKVLGVYIESDGNRHWAVTFSWPNHSPLHAWGHDNHDIGPGLCIRSLTDPRVLTLFSLHCWLSHRQSENHELNPWLAWT